MSTYKDRIVAGLCGKCGNERDDAGSLCKTCREQARQRAAEKRARNRDSGACVNCGKPTTSGKRCDRCKKTGKASRERATKRRKESGQCVACSNPAKENCTLCQGCIDKRSKVSSDHYHRRREQGLCSYCSDLPAPGQTMCKFHLRQARDYRFRTKMEALDQYGGPACTSCGMAEADVLEIDHIDGGGRKHRREVSGGRGGHTFYQWLKRNDYPAGFRVLCPTCNKKAHLGTLSTD